jgi:uncharacterized membrane protein HdeD (DUF308 family)
MTVKLTPREVASGDALSQHMEKMWGWYLVGGIVSILFGFVLLSYEIVGLFALVYFACAYFVAVGIFQIAGSSRVARHRWMYIVMGVVSVGAGIVGLAWPGITLFVIAVLIGWVFLFWGVTDVVHALDTRHLRHWWIYLLRGLLSIIIGVVALRDPGAAILALVLVVGIWSIVFGVAEIMASLTARHGRRHWDEFKSASQS